MDVGLYVGKYVNKKADMELVSRGFFFSSRRRHTRFDCDWSSDVCSSEVLAKTASASTLTRADEFTGILPDRAIRDMVKAGDIVGSLLRPIEPDQIQPASIDLRLGDFAYPVDTSFLPGKDLTVLEKLKRLDPDFESVKLDLSKGNVLEKGRIYVIPLLESVNLPTSE